MKFITLNLTQKQIKTLQTCISYSRALVMESILGQTDDYWIDHYIDEKHNIEELQDIIDSY